MDFKSIVNRPLSRHQSGTTLLEVLIGMVIFAIGILALVQLQGNLSKGSADANARTVAINIAEETIEAARTFSQVTAGVGVNAFNNIVTGTATESRGGITYTIARTVTDYWYNPATATFGTAKPNSTIVNADVKRLQVTVTWGGGQTFQVDETQSTSGLAPGSITLTDMISSITSPSGGKVVMNSTNSNLYGPPVDYNPGENPDIISIKLGENRFKESTTPVPDVIRADELVETKFDVVTYSQSDQGATFLRREEFVAVSCECTLKTSGGPTEGGLRPTIWNGNDYTEGEFVNKAWGESANNQQSSFCSICCRDHHDGGTGSLDVGTDTGRARTNPFRNSADYWVSADGESGLTGDHKHYNRSNSGTLSLTRPNGTYVEACRLVRKDGFLRIAQDLRQEGNNSFPASYLDETTEVAVYSDYVTDTVSLFEGAVSDNYETNPPAMTKPPNMSPVVTFPASATSNASVMTSASSSQQLRNRGIYVDYLTDEMRTLINCFDSGGTGSSCGAEGANSALEVIPFYDVQLTWLARWNETPNNAPVDVSNEALEDDNTHSRGIAGLTTGLGYSTINAASHRGNLGLTGTDPIDSRYTAETASYNLYALALVFSSPPPATSITVTGDILSSVGGVKGADVEITGTSATCDRTLTGFECTMTGGAVNPRIKISNYFKRNKVLVGCSSTLATYAISSSATDISLNFTTFTLPMTSITGQHIVIKENTCT